MKTKKSFLNFITDVVPLIIMALLGLYKSKLLIEFLSSNVVGLYQLYSQLLSYVTLFDFGIMGAILYRFFGPVKEKNQEKINIVFSSGMRSCLFTSLLIIVVAIIFSFVIPVLIKDNPFNYSYILLTFLLYIATNIIYYLIFSYKILLDAQQKKYINNIIIEVSNVIKSILEIISIVVFKNLIILLLVGIFTTIISSIIVVIVCKKHNPDLKYVKEKDKSLFQDVKNLLVHKFAFLINCNIDMLLITNFLGLGYVVVYSTYNYITNMLNKIVSKIYVSVVPSLGSLIIDSKEKAKNVFFELNNFGYFIAIILTTTLTYSIGQFIGIWYEGEIVSSYLLGFCFSIVLFENITIQSLSSISDASGFFKQTKKSSIIGASLNLILSLIFINYMGIPGVLLATFISHIIADNFVKARVICVELFTGSTKKYYKDFTIYMAIEFLIIGIEYLLLKDLSCINILQWFMYSLALFVINALIVLIMFKLLKKLDFIKRLKILFKKSSNNNVK